MLPILGYGLSWMQSRRPGLRTFREIRNVFSTVVSYSLTPSNHGMEFDHEFRGVDRLIPFAHHQSHVRKGRFCPEHKHAVHEFGAKKRSSKRRRGRGTRCTLRASSRGSFSIFSPHIYFLLKSAATPSESISRQHTEKSWIPQTFCCDKKYLVKIFR